MNTLEIALITSVLMLGYIYIGYGVLMYGISVVRKAKKAPFTASTSITPSVTLVIAAYNERDILPEKIMNISQLSYPSELLDILFITDGSSDGTPEYLQSHTNYRVLHLDERSGKSAALNRAMQEVTSDITVFTDANTFLNEHAILNLVQPYANAGIGAVAGEKRVGISDTEKAHGAGEGLYWKYESKLKSLDSEVGSVVGAAGELFSVRTHLYSPVPHDTILDDFIISMRIAQAGYKVAYVSDAFALEGPSASLAEEMKRKTRICAGGFQAMTRLPQLLNATKHPFLTFQYVSHRVLRWTLGPLMLPLIFILNAMLVFYATDSGANNGSILEWLFQAFFLFQVAMYGAAAMGWFRKNQGLSKSWLFIPLYFFIMNLSAYIGFWRFIRNSQSAVWARAARAT